MQIEKILRGIVVVGVFALPLVVLIVSSSMYFPYITGKNFTFRILVEVFFSAWLALAIINAQYRPRWTTLLLSVTVLMGILAVANIFGENPSRSFWSNFERMEGFITYLHLFAYVLAAGTVLTTERIWLWLWRTSLGVSVVISLHTLSQFVSSGGDFRLASTLGNPIYLAVYAMFHIFIALVLATRRDIRKGEQLTYLVVLTLLVITLFFTATRGATLGLVGGLFIAATGIALTLRGSKTLRLSALGVGVLILILAGGMWFARDSTFIQENRTLNRLTNISLEESNISARAIVWGMAWEGIKERPILGWGQGNFIAAFSKYYDSRMYQHEEWYDRTHNVLIDWLIATGVLGFLAYISIFLALIWAVYKAVSFTLVQKWLVVGLLAAYGFQNLTVFDNIVSIMLFMTLVAWVYAMSRIERHEDVGSAHTWELPQKLYIPAAVGAVVLAVSLVWILNLSQMHTAATLLDALRYANTAIALGQNDREEEAVAYAQESLGMFEEIDGTTTLGAQEAAEQWALTSGKLFTVAWLSDEEKTQWYTESLTALERRQERAPRNARVAAFIGALHQAAGNTQAAREKYEYTLSLTPRKQSILTQLILLEANAGDIELARTHAQEMFQSETSNDAARMLYVALLIRTGAVEQAFELLKEAPQVALDTNVLGELIRNGLHNRAREAWELGLLRENNLEDLNAVFVLARTYASRGDTQRAAQEVRYIAETYPQLQEFTNAALQEIQQAQQ